MAEQIVYIEMPPGTYGIASSDPPFASVQVLRDTVTEQGGHYETQSLLVLDEGSAQVRTLRDWSPVLGLSALLTMAVFVFARFGVRVLRSREVLG